MQHRKNFDKKSMSSANLIANQIKMKKQSSASKQQSGGILIEPDVPESSCSNDGKVQYASGAADVGVSLNNEIYSDGAKTQPNPSRVLFSNPAVLIPQQD